jgi:hypothetical protein
MPQTAFGHLATFGRRLPDRTGIAISLVVSLSGTRYNFAVPDTAVSVESIVKLFPPARSGWRSFLQPFERPTIPALQDISFDVREGEAVALLGANGAGKSTLLRILSTLLLPTSGHARIAGHDAAQSPRDVRRNLGYHAGSDLGFYARLFFSSAASSFFSATACFFFSSNASSFSFSS